MMLRPIMVVAGARPNFVKVAPILHELRARGAEGVFVHTGQHYDHRLSQVLLDDLGLGRPDVELEVGSASHAVQTARVMERFEPVLLAHKPSALVLVGDVNSTLACALVAAKLRSETRTTVVHVEAGLRSADWRMPEEINRVLTDRLSDLLLTPSRDAHQNLAREGIPERAVHFVGNVMIDSLYAVLRGEPAFGAGQKSIAAESTAPPLLVTLHRPSNVDDPSRLRIVVEALARFSQTTPVVFPMHPRTRAKAQEAGLEAHLAKLTICEPLGYRQMIEAQFTAAAIATDSGGVQEESTVLGVPCLTLREQTERPVTISHGTNTLATWPLSVESLTSDLQELLSRARRPLGSHAPEGWDGLAAQRIVDAVLQEVAP